jgi:hypothetical protein
VAEQVVFGQGLFDEEQVEGIECGERGDIGTGVTVSASTCGTPERLAARGLIPPGSTASPVAGIDVAADRSTRKPRRR